MTMQSSGALTLNEVNLELRNESLSAVSLGDARVRSLANKSSGAISFSDFYNRNFDIKGQSNYTDGGLYTFTVPEKITSISAVCVGGGGSGFGSGDGGVGGGGGALAWDAAISTTPNEDLTVISGKGGVAGSYGSNSGTSGDASWIIRGDYFTVSQIALSSNVATITTSAEHGFSEGDEVVIDISDEGQGNTNAYSRRQFSGLYTITSVPTTTTFTYDLTYNNLSTTSVTTGYVAHKDNVLLFAIGGFRGGLRNNSYQDQSGDQGFYIASIGGDGGGSGGRALYASNSDINNAGSGAGGAGGYSGNGGTGSVDGSRSGEDGTGGAGGGGGLVGSYQGGYGGGVGILGAGASGTGGVYGGQGAVYIDAPSIGNGTAGSNGSGQLYGGGGRGQDNSTGGSGGSGAVRIIWGENRLYSASTQTLSDVTIGEYFE